MVAQENVKYVYELRRVTDKIRGLAYDIGEMTPGERAAVNKVVEEINAICSSMLMDVKKNETL